MKGPRREACYESKERQLKALVADLLAALKSWISLEALRAEAMDGQDESEILDVAERAFDIHMHTEALITRAERRAGV